MPSPKVLEILRKYAAQPAGPTDPTPDLQTKSPAELAYELQMKTRVVAAELEHDIGLLKTRGFDREMWKLMMGVWNKVEEISKNIKDYAPLESARQILSYVRDKHTRAIIDNLIFLSEHHIKNTNVDFIPSKNVIHPEVKGLPMLNHLANFAEQMLKQSPQDLKVTWKPPMPSGNVTMVNIPPSPSVPTLSEIADKPVEQSV